MEAQPGALSGAGARQAGIAENLFELSGRMTAGAVQSWQASLAIVAESVG